MSVLKGTGSGNLPKTVILLQTIVSAVFRVICGIASKQCLIASLLVLESSQALADRSMASEYEVKAAFIYNIAKFVSWPSYQETSTEGLTLCILGNDPFGKALDVIRGKRSGTKIWEIRYLRVVDKLLTCRILFIAASEAERAEEILDSLDGKPVLTIGDSDGFAARGGIINFFIEDRKVRFEINIDAAHRSSLNISSQLLKLAKIVRERSGYD